MYVHNTFYNRILLCFIIINYATFTNLNTSAIAYMELIIIVMIKVSCIIFTIGLAMMLLSSVVERFTSVLCVMLEGNQLHCKFQKQPAQHGMNTSMTT